MGWLLTLVPLPGGLRAQIVRTEPGRVRGGRRRLRVTHQPGAHAWAHTVCTHVCHHMCGRLVRAITYVCTFFQTHTQAHTTSYRCTHMMCACCHPTRHTRVPQCTHAYPILCVHTIHARQICLQSDTLSHTTRSPSQTHTHVHTTLRPGWPTQVTRAV